MTFYDRILDWSVLGPYFANTDVERPVDHQTEFVASLMGGSARYTNDHLERMHVDLGITESAFAEAMDLMRETLEDHDFEKHDVDQVTDEMQARKSVIVSRR